MSYRYCPYMPGGLSPGHRLLRTRLLNTSSYDVLLKLMGPMHLRDVKRVIDKAIYWSF